MKFESFQKQKQPSAEERAKIEKARTISDAELLKGGAEYKIDGKNEKRLEPTGEQVEEAKEEMEIEIKQVNPEQALYHHEGVREKIEEKSVRIYSTGERFEGLLAGLGVKSENLADEEKRKLQLFAEYAGKRLLNAALNLEGAQYQNVGDVLRALEKHAKELAPFAIHDPIHTMVAYRINSGPEAEPSRKNSPVPEFLRPNHSKTQAIIEELPAVMWTGIFDKKSPFILLMEGNITQGLNRLEQEDFKAVGNKARFEQLKKEISELNRSDFQSFIKVYADFTLYLVEVANKAKEKRTDLSAEQAEQLEERDRKYDESFDVVRKLFSEELGRFVSGKNEENVSRESRTLKLFLEKAKAIFDNYSKDPKVLLNEFMAMGNSLFERLSQRESLEKAEKEKRS